MSDKLNFNFLKSLKGRVVRTYKGGPESNIGKLLSVGSDYFVIQTEENEIVYY
jgi:spore coat protein B